MQFLGKSKVECLFVGKYDLSEQFPIWQGESDTKDPCQLLLRSEFGCESYVPECYHGDASQLRDDVERHMGQKEFQELHRLKHSIINMMDMYTKFVKRMLHLVAKRKSSDTLDHLPIKRKATDAVDVPRDHSKRKTCDEFREAILELHDIVLSVKKDAQEAKAIAVDLKTTSECASTATKESLASLQGDVVATKTAMTALRSDLDVSKLTAEDTNVVLKDLRAGLTLAKKEITDVHLTKPKVDTTPRCTPIQTQLVKQKVQGPSPWESIHLKLRLLAKPLVFSEASLAVAPAPSKNPTHSVLYVGGKIFLVASDALMRCTGSVFQKQLSANPMNITFCFPSLSADVFEKVARLVLGVETMMNLFVTQSAGFMSRMHRELLFYGLVSFLQPVVTDSPVVLNPLMTVSKEDLVVTSDAITNCWTAKPDHSFEISFGRSDVHLTSVSLGIKKIISNPNATSVPCLNQFKIYIVAPYLGADQFCFGSMEPQLPARFGELKDHTVIARGVNRSNEDTTLELTVMPGDFICQKVRVVFLGLSPVSSSVINLLLQPLVFKGLACIRP